MRMHKHVQIKLDMLQSQGELLCSRSSSHQRTCSVGKSTFVVVGAGLRRCVYDHNIHDAPWGVDENEENAGCVCTDTEVLVTEPELTALIAAVGMVGIDPELDS